MTNQQWRLAFGAIAVLCSFLLVQPLVQQAPLVALIVGAVNAVVAFLKAPSDDAGE